MRLMTGMPAALRPAQPGDDGTGVGGEKGDEIGLLSDRLVEMLGLENGVVWILQIGHDHAFGLERRNDLMPEFSAPPIEVRAGDIGHLLALERAVRHARRVLAEMRSLPHSWKASRSLRPQSPARRISLYCSSLPPLQFQRLVVCPFLSSEIACGWELAASYLKMAASKMTNSHRVSSATLSRPLRVLLAGLGAFGKEHLSRLSERSDVKVVGVADTNPAVLEPIRARLGVAECLTDPLRLIDVVEADAIIVATPAVSHIEISVRALSRNLSVLLEKPVAPSASSAVPLLAAAHSATGFIMPGHVLRFSQDHLRMVETVRSGRIGEVIYVNSRRYRDDSHAVRYPHD